MADAQGERGVAAQGVAQAAEDDVRQGEHGDGLEAPAFAERPVSGQARRCCVHRDGEGATGRR